MLVVFCVGVLVPVAVSYYNNSQEPPHWLMVIKAEQGEFQETTDRPDRQAQGWDTTEFLDYWASDFNTDPPHAVISADSEAAMTINNPPVSGDTVTFTATPLPGQTLPTDTINQPTLFIDALAPSNCPWAVVEPSDSTFVPRCVSSAT